MKRIFIKIYKFILLVILLIRSLFRKLFAQEGDTGSGTVKKRDYVLNLSSLSNIYDETGKLVKQINEFKNKITTKEEKQSIIASLNEKLDLIKEETLKTDTKNRFDEVKKEQILKKAFKSSILLSNYAYDHMDKKVDEETDSDEMGVKEISKEDILNLSFSKTRDLYAMYVYEANALIKETNITLKEIEEDIKNNTKLENNRYKLEEIKSKIKTIQDNYYEFKHNRYIYELENDFNLKEIDKENILVDSKSLQETLKKCNVLLTKIDEYKKHENVKVKSEVEIKKEEKKREEKTKKSEPEEKKPRLLYDILEASNIIEKDIERQSKMIQKFEQTILNSPTFEIKGRRLGFFDNLINNTIRFSLNLLPFKMFRNRRLSLLVSGYILNNNIRSMRKVVTNDSVCSYIALGRNIKTEQDISSSYERILNDSMYQVSVLKDEFVNHYGYLETNEVKKIYTKLETLEANITKEIDRINDARAYLNKVKRITRKRP